MKKRKNKVIVTERDMVLLDFLHKRKVADYNLIRKHVFGETSSRYVIMRRLKKLQSVGLIKFDSKMRGLSLIKTFSITRNAFNSFIKNPSIRYKNLKLFSEHVVHDLELSRIADRFLQDPSIKKFYFENEICDETLNEDLDEFNSYREIRSDAAVECQRGEDTYFLGLEYESRAKSSKRYEEILKKYYASDSIQGVFYICSDIKILNKISKLESKMVENGYNKFMYGISSEVIENTEELTFCDMNGEKVTF